MTAISSLVYQFGGQPEERARAEKLADEMVQLYTKAANFIYANIDKRSGNMKGGWPDEQRDLLGLVEMEKKDRKDLAKLFGWSQAAKAGPGDGGRPARLGTTLPDK